MARQAVNPQRLILHRNAIIMTRMASIELRDLHISTIIGTYGPDDVVPDSHILDLTLTIAPELVHVSTDDMALIFDYDPLVLKIAQIARGQKFETQEYLATLISRACADYEQITAMEIDLRKQPVLDGTGSLGVRQVFEAEDMAALRHHDT
jgi:dihydroneopterin aldolase